MFEEKIYRSKFSKYPTPIHYINDEEKLAIVCIPWGNKESADKAINIIKEYFLSAKTDIESTSPFPLSPDMSLSANHLRIAVMLANSALAKEDNADEYTCGIEIIAVCLNDREVNVASVGGPSFLCKKRGKDLVTYTNHHHLGHEHPSSKKYPLPKDLIGIQIKKTIDIQSFRYHKNDQFYFLLNDYLPNLTKEDDYKTIQEKLDKEQPYWLSKWKLAI